MVYFRDSVNTTMTSTDAKHLGQSPLSVNVISLELIWEQSDNSI